VERWSAGLHCMCACVLHHPAVAPPCCATQAHKRHSVQNASLILSTYALYLKLHRSLCEGRNASSSHLAANTLPCSIEPTTLVLCLINNPNESVALCHIRCCCSALHHLLVPPVCCPGLCPLTHPFVWCGLFTSLLLSVTALTVYRWLPPPASSRGGCGAQQHALSHSLHLRWV